ncbi:MAG: NAD(P)H-hydrate dehydratase [Armatimonadetes bacterium]|nr:NAD(P)H-hydrate dehydratase [Armatimonadota bacterium]MDE2206630.1 NAD(P)H-hydrate dehydratase [Armatimonadota bacterium]
MKVATAQQMRDADAAAAQLQGMSSAILMENAGAAVARAARDMVSVKRGQQIAVFCGPGNNGGDGLAAARHLAAAGFGVRIVLAADVGRPRGDAARQYQAAHACGVQVCAGAELSRCDLAVDALLGTGAVGAPRDEIAHAIRCVTALDCPILSVDIPSGVECDTGYTPGAAVSADTTITFAFKKRCMFLFPGADHAGRVLVDPIGICWDRLVPETGVRSLDIGEFAAPAFAWAQQCLFDRHANTNKGDYGRAAIVAGSAGMIGAPRLAGRAALRTGAGLVTVFAPSSIQQVVAAGLEAALTVPLAEAEGQLAAEAADAVLGAMRPSAVLALGPGIGTGPGANAVTERLLTEWSGSIVLDADGLNCLAQMHREGRSPLPRRAGSTLLTPHPGEAARLLDSTISVVEADRFAAAAQLAREYGAVVLLKGRYTIIAEPEGSLSVNVTGNPGMARGGSGDTLTGMIVALLAQAEMSGSSEASNARMAAAAALGCYLHGLAGDIASESYGETSMTPEDITASIGCAIARMRSSL